MSNMDKSLDRKEMEEYGIHEKNFYNGDLYEQKMDEEDLDVKPEENESFKLKGTKVPGRGPGRPRKNPLPEEGPEPVNAAPLITPNQYGSIKKGDQLQIVIDQWHNANFIPKNTVFTVVSFPIKRRRAQGNQMIVENFVHGQLLMETGQVVDLRTNIDHCRFPDPNDLPRQNGDLLW